MATPIHSIQQPAGPTSLADLAADVSLRHAKINVGDFSSPDKKVQRSSFNAFRTLCKTYDKASINSVQAGLQVGAVLCFARETKFYRRGPRKLTFVEFASQFGIGETYAGTLADAASDWLPLADHPVQPATIDSLRPLKRVDEPATKRAAWDIATKDAAGQPDKKRVDAAVRKLLGEPEKVRPKSKLQLLAEEVLAHLDKSDLTGARARLLLEIVDFTDDSSAEPAAPEIPVLNGVELPMGSVIYAGPDCTIRRQGEVMVVEAHPDHGQDMINLGLVQDDVPGKWVAGPKIVRRSSEAVLVERVRNALKQQRLGGLDNG